MLQERATLLRRVLIFLDLCLVGGAFAVAVKLQHVEPVVTFVQGVNGLRLPVLSDELYLPYMLLAVMLWVATLYHYEGYSSIRKKAYPALAWMICKSVVVATLLFSMVVFISNAGAIVNRFFVVIVFLCTLVFLLTQRFILLRFLHAIRRKGYNYRRFLIVGSGMRAKKFARSLEAHREWGLKVFGFIDEPEFVGQEIEGKKVIGTFDDLEEILDNNVVDEVVFIMPRKWMNQVEKYIKICEKVGVRVNVALDLFNPTIATPRLREFDDIPLLCLETVPSNTWGLFVKRCMDVLISGVALIILSPVFLAVGVLIKLTSPGPVILKQERAGQNGRKFTMYKFRTMVVGAEKMLDEIKSLNESKGPVFHSRSDPRVTKPGKFVRKFSLDELPQLWNVFKGNMSIVGPRPPLLSELKGYERWQRRRLSLKPGLVCLWQVTRRYQADFEEWVKTDLGYIDNWSLGLDFKILLKILPAIYKGARHWSG